MGIERQTGLGRLKNINSGLPMEKICVEEKRIREPFELYYYPRDPDQKVFILKAKFRNFRDFPQGVRRWISGEFKLNCERGRVNEMLLEIEYQDSRTIRFQGNQLVGRNHLVGTVSFGKDNNKCAVVFSLNDGGIQLSDNTLHPDKGLERWLNEEFEYGLQMVSTVIAHGLELHQARK